MTLSEIITTAFNSNDCSILTGLIMGQLLTIRLIIIFIASFFIYRLIERYLILPLINYIENRFKKNER